MFLLPLLLGQGRLLSFQPTQHGSAAAYLI